MKSFAELYLAYLELAIISMVLASLTCISVSAWAYGGVYRLLAGSAFASLVLIILVAIGRQRTANAHPEFKRKAFGEIRLFTFMLQQKIAKVTVYFNSRSTRQVIQQNLSRIMAIAVVMLIIAILGSSLVLSADISSKRKQTLLENQTRVLVKTGNPATIFNEEITIELIKVSESDSGYPAKVTAIIKSEGLPEMRIDEIVGSEIIYNAQHEFHIQILEASNLGVWFFVQRVID